MAKAWRVLVPVDGCDVGSLWSACSQCRCYRNAEGGGTGKLASPVPQRLPDSLESSGLTLKGQ